MPEHSSVKAEAEESAARISEIIEAHAEWLYVREGLRASGLRRSELEFRAAHQCLIFYCLSDEGIEVWRVHAWAWNNEKLLLTAERRAGRERSQLELIPRIRSSALAEEVSGVRRARCARLAHLARAQLPGASIVRASLSAGVGFNRPGSFARILLEHRRARVAVTGIVTEARPERVDALLSSTLIWLARLCETSSTPPKVKLWILIEKPLVETLRQRLSLLRDDLRSAVTIYELDEAWASLTEIPQYEIDELLSLRLPRINICRTVMTETAARIMALAPHAIDVVRARRGETLRFHGLAFARVRRAMNQERVWFGLNPSSRRILGDDTLAEWEKLLKELAEHRRADTPDRYHALYKQSPEAWLESILRRDVTRLDPGLRLAPLHAQFRAAQTETGGGSRPVDLLALRHDGRLAVIELKVAEDREHVLQAADYWRRMESYRQSGAIARARLFDDAEIADEPPLVYLAAPALSFHRALRPLARALRKEIELYRFDLNEDWRAGVRVIGRERLS